ncbi:helix-turn-helix transcriptional regulator [Actinacidiphila guanduensis]|uniref:Helix-turn-helix domain-containing protein n=1 Tax=Actinacidiphila guanduensis TaxID=310781 RepID=A0A1H0SRR3_9ACTN|nr:helix-turn-helix transcriptional regulator [Actinacidiphila guanduensis]SDP44239.1 Helix-turn-helix domain-containing protein [Actinacidiphila guanduensis]
MNSEGSLREFLTSRRARLRPEDVGLPPSPTPRRRPGLRREEVAVLAGVSVDYYARLEQGRIGKVSDQVLTAIEEALRLDALERHHLRALVDTYAGGPRRAARTGTGSHESARVGLRELVGSLDPLPAMVQSRRMDVLAVNNAGKVLLTDFDRMQVRDRNIVRWLFTDPQARVRYPDWDEVASNTVAALRGARDPRLHDPELERLVGELSVASSEFAALWADYRLFRHSHGSKRLFHQTVGVLDLRYETFPVPGTEGQTLTIYTAPRGSAADDRLRLLLSWDATSRSETKSPGHASID